MSGWNKLALLRVIAGTGQTLSVTTSAASFTNKLGSQTRAIALALEPTATATGCTVTITNSGTAATASTDLFIKTTDSVLFVGANPGDVVNAKGLAACVLHLTEMSY